MPYLKLGELGEALEDVMTSSLQTTPSQHLTEGKCLEIVKRNGLELQYVPRNLKTYEMCMEAVMSNGKAIQYVPDELSTYHLDLAAVKQNGDALFLLKEQPTDEMYLEYMKHEGSILSKVPEEFRTSELIQLAMNHDVSAIGQVPQTPEKCLAAVKSDWRAIKYVEKQFITKEMVDLVQPCYWLEYFIPPELMTDDLSKRLEKFYAEKGFETVGPFRINLTTDCGKHKHPCLHEVVTSREHWPHIRYCEWNPFEHPQRLSWTTICRLLEDNGLSHPHFKRQSETPMIVNSDKLREAKEFDEDAEDDAEDEEQKEEDEIDDESEKDRLHAYWMHLNRVRSNGLLLALVPKELVTAEMCEIAMRSGGRMSNVPKRFITPEMCLQTVKKDVQFLFDVPQDMLTKDLCVEAIRSDHRAINCIPKIKLTEEVCAEAIKIDPMNFYRLDKDLLTKAICDDFVRYDSKRLSDIPVNVLDNVR